jgi:hypothetical protein
VQRDIGDARGVEQGLARATLLFDQVAQQLGGQEQQLF